MALLYPGTRYEPSAQALGAIRRRRASPRRSGRRVCRAERDLCGRLWPGAPRISRAAALVVLGPAAWRAGRCSSRLRARLADSISRYCAAITTLEGWPRSPSAARRLRVAWRKLEERGTPRWRRVRGSDWNDAVIGDMGRIEAQSWIARSTDGSGAKFMRPHQQQLWREALSDPVIATSLCATILMLDDRPIAFSFDLDDGAWQYGIAGSYVEDLADCNIGKLVNYKALEDAIADGQSVMDMGAGDSGYKRAMGATAGYDFADLLFVRSRTAARVIARVWAKAASAELQGAQWLGEPIPCPPARRSPAQVRRR